MNGIVCAAGQNINSLVTRARSGRLLCKVRGNDYGTVSLRYERPAHPDRDSIRISSRLQGSGITLVRLFFCSRELSTFRVTRLILTGVRELGCLMCTPLHVPFILPCTSKEMYFCVRFVLESMLQQRTAKECR